MKSRTYNIVGILNITPDSFYDGGRYDTHKSAIDRAQQMVEEGADMIDIGGESTRPGSAAVPMEDEVQRVIPVIREISSVMDVPISVDTYKSEIAQRAIDVGATLVNDISGGTMDARMFAVIARNKVKYILGHIQGTPKNMQANPTYTNVISDITQFFKRQIDQAKARGVVFDQFILDPGIGFGKTLEHNIEIFRALEKFLVLGCPLMPVMPVMIGASRKSFIGKIQKDSGPKDRLAGSLTAALWSYLKGATYFRVHDVLETKRALQMMEELSSPRRRGSNP